MDTAAPSNTPATWLDQTVAEGWRAAGPFRFKALGDYLASARTLFLQILATFQYTPRDFAAWHPGLWRWLLRDHYAWLRPLERLARRVVVMEALSLALAQVLPVRKARLGAKPRRAARRPWDRQSEPETWSVSFRTIVGQRIDRRRRTRRKWPTLHEQMLQPVGSDMIGKNGEFARVLCDTGPLARRLEAVRRVLVDPAKAARRVAYRMARLTREAVMYFIRPYRGPRNLPGLCADEIRDADAECAMLARAFFESG